MENGTQLNLIQYLSEYIQKPETATSTLPANVGLNDATLSGLIAQYNALILERNRLLRTSSEANPVVRRLDSNIQDMRADVIHGRPVMRHASARAPAPPPPPSPPLYAAAPQTDGGFAQ